MRLLLDQNFPGPPEGLLFEVLDKTVSIQHFSVVFPAHAKVSTPDWKLYLLARREQFDAVITSDDHQLDQSTEMIALRVTGLGLVTWKSGQDDPVVLYGQLLAYMPQIVSELRVHPGVIVVLPKARLRQQEHFQTPRGVLGAMQRRDRISYPEQKSQAIRVMRASLENDGVDKDLLAMLPDR